MPPAFFPHPPFGRKRLLRILIWAFAGSAALLLAIYLLAVFFPFR